MIDFCTIFYLHSAFHLLTATVAMHYLSCPVPDIPLITVNILTTYQLLLHNCHATICTTASKWHHTRDSLKREPVREMPAPGFAAAAAVAAGAAADGAL